MGRKLVDVEADVGFEVWANDLNSLFEEAALAMYEVMVDVESVNPVVRKELELESEDLSLLLHSWLSELLFITDVEGLVFSKFEVTIQGTKLRGKAWGEPVDPERHKPKTEVKAVTYYKLKVEKEGDLWRAVVILDL
ncbi:MAG: archease [Candidatus Korarchaeota archaeon]|nr:archease [Candidatus Korarchaeota archaeon]